MKKALIITLIIIIAITVMAVGIMNYYNDTVNTENIYSGVFIDEYDMSDMNAEEAKEYLKLKLQDRGEKLIRLHYGDIYFTFPYNTLGYSADIDSAVEEAFKYARDGNPIERLAEVLTLRKTKKHIELKESFDNEKINLALDTVSQDINRDAKNAYFEVHEGEFTIHPEEDGLVLNKTLAREYINKNLDKNDDIELPVDSIAAEITQDKFKNLNGIIGEATTNYSASIENRKSNVRLGASKFDGLTVMPNQSVSFNETLGEISENTGYLPAGVIINGQFDTGIGGGICQVSTTIYNALLDADLTILQRRNHSRPVNYIKRGLDCAVATGLLDLRFKNEFDFPIYIMTKADDDNITVYILGDKNKKDYTVELEVENVETVDFNTKTVIDNSMAPGESKVDQPGNKGYRTRTYKIKKRNGEIISKELISNDYYPARDKIVIMGPTPPKEETTESKPTSSNSSKDSDKTVNVLEGGN
ncbi:MAG: VanW family protein [Tissierellia bacterium]|nr:VanW family protein [Tissierellia bacterium]